MLKNKGNMKLSFHADDEEDNENDAIPSSKIKKPLNKLKSNGRIKQAEVKLLVPEEDPKSIVTSGQYDSSSIQELLQKQKFANDVSKSATSTNTEESKTHGEQHAEEVVILNGEDAELLEKQTENPEDISPEEKSLLRKLESKSITGKKRGRISMKFEAEDGKKDLDMNQEDDIDYAWEREILKRGSVKNIPDFRRKPSSGDFSTSSLTTAYEPVDVRDILKNIQSALSKLEEIVQQDEREFEKLNVEISVCTKQLEELYEKKRKLEENPKNEEMSGPDSEHLETVSSEG
jgi:hypothetical protein